MSTHQVLVSGLCCILMGFTAGAYARNGVSIGYGRGTKQVNAYRVNVQRAWSNNNMTPNKRRIYGYWELGFTQMHNPVQYWFTTNNNLEATSGSGVLRIPIKLIGQCYVDLGIGVAYLTNEHIATRNLGARWLFEERVGAGVLFGPWKQYELGYRLTHFSNGYLAQANQSMNLHLIMLGYWFR